MNSLINISRNLLLAVTRLEYERFMCEIKNPERTIEKTFRGVLRELSSSKYGQLHKIKTNSSFKDFSSNLPVISYEDISSYIMDSSFGKPSYLTSSKIKGYEQTSGSSSSRKIIPYTQAGLKQFQKYFSIYIYDTLKYRPKLKSFKTFYSISPPPIKGIKDVEGFKTFQNDEDYLGFFGKNLIRKYSAIPSSICRVDNFKEFKIRLAIYLLNAKNLEICFIWSPSYLISLLEFIKDYRLEILEYLNSWKSQIDKLPNLKRIQNILIGEELDTNLIWPNLKLISCWTEANSKGFSNQLGKLFPKVEIQPKGLLSTEAALTIRLYNTPYAIPLIGLNYLEFLMEDGSFCPMMELTENKTYELVISNRNGLYRYRTNDVVIVRGYWNQLPLLEFIGRNNILSDMVGEKIIESQVSSFLKPFQIDNSTWMLVPDIINRKYRILTNKSDIDFDVSQKLEKLLLENYHYRYAREMGQLKCVQLNIVPRLLNIYEKISIKNGMKWGDIKVPFLISNIELAKDLISYALITDS